MVEHCRNEAMSNMADIRDAYERFYRLRERYYHEDKAGTLSPIRLAALSGEVRPMSFSLLVFCRLRAAHGPALGDGTHQHRQACFCQLERSPGHRKYISRKGTRDIEKPRRRGAHRGFGFHWGEPVMGREKPITKHPLYTRCVPGATSGALKG